MWEDNGYKVYDIADGAGGWMKTSPDAHNAYVRDIDDPLGGKVKPLIRFLKAGKCFKDVPISSFYLDCAWPSMRRAKSQLSMTST